MKTQNNFLQKVIYYAYIVTFLLDPTGTIIKIKLPILFLFLFISVLRMKTINYVYVILFVGIYAVLFSSSLNMLINNYDYKENLWIGYFKTFINFLPLVFFEPKIEWIIKPYIISSIIISILTITVSFIMLYIPIIAYLFEKDPWNTLFLIQYRPILGKEFLMDYHLSISTTILGLGYKFYYYLLYRRLKDILLVVLYAVALFFSGARANILSEMLILFFITIYYLIKKKKQIVFPVTLLLIGLTCALFLVFLLLTEETSGSSDIKRGHSDSYMILFNNPNLLLFGSGPGSTFYSLGFKSITALTELTYYDLIRMFGLIGTVFILLLYVYPIINLYLKKSDIGNITILCFFAYLFIAGTNPLLITPQGIMLLYIVSSISNSEAILNPYTFIKPIENVRIRK